MSLEIEQMGQAWGQEAIEVSGTGAEEGLWVSGALEWQLYCIFIQRMKCSLDFADSRACP